MGSWKRNSLSNLPGLLSAGSMLSILLVAPTTITSPLLSSPSMSASKVETMLEWMMSFFDDLTGASPSISSKKIIEGLMR